MLENGMNCYGKRKCIDFIPWLVAPDEVFRYITDREVPGIKPYYMISNYGRVYSRYYEIPFLTFNIDTKGYWMFSVMMETGRTKILRVHRTVKLIFDYQPGCERLYVDHIDHNKLNPHLSNLDWVTEYENNDRKLKFYHDYGVPQQFAPQYLVEDNKRLRQLQEQLAIERLEAETLRKSIPVDYTQKNFNDLKAAYNCQSEKGDKTRVRHSDEEVHKICEMLQEGYTAAHIATLLHIKKQYVAAVHYGNARLDISCNYDFSKYGTILYHDKWQFTTEQVHAICKYLSENNINNRTGSKKYFIYRMLAILGIEFTDSKYSSVMDIISKRGYASVSKDYNF